MYILYSQEYLYIIINRLSFNFSFWLSKSLFIMQTAIYLGDGSLILTNTKRDNKLDRFKISSCIDQENNTSLKKKVCVIFFTNQFYILLY